MSDAAEVFSFQKSNDHVQYEEINKLYDMFKKGKVFLGLSEEEFKSILSDLAQDEVSYSNHMVIDMIIKKVLEKNSDDRLLKILNNIKVAHVDSSKKIIGSAYPKYSDGSYYVEIGEDIEKQIRLLSDLFAILFMRNEKLHEMEKIILEELLKINTDRFKLHIESTDDYNSIQILMMLCDRLYNDGFTDKYIAYSTEINEMALAFFIGHEIGHHYLGHTEEIHHIKGDERILELKADSFAVDFAIQYMQNAYKNNLNGIHLFSSIYLPLIASMDICENIYMDQDKHPSLIKRIVGVQRALSKRLVPPADTLAWEYRQKLLKIIGFPMNVNDIQIAEKI